MSAMNVGGRLDRLPLTRLHRKVFYLVGVGMFFEGFDIYIAASVLGATYKTGFSTLAENGLFISITFVGMTLGALLTGFLGDRYGRRFTYQVNLLIFGAAALASVFAPDMRTLIALRFVMGLGLGAEVVVGYSIMAEFFPARIRGRWSGMISTIVTAGLPVSALLAWLLVPIFGWRVMFLLGAVGAMVAWYLRRGLPELPRWLVVMGRHAEADAIVSSFEQEAGFDFASRSPANSRNDRGAPYRRPIPAPLAAEFDRRVRFSYGGKYAHLRICDLAPDLLHWPRELDCTEQWLRAADGTRRADRVRARSVRRRLSRSQADDRGRLVPCCNPQRCVRVFRYVTCRASHWLLSDDTDLHTRGGPFRRIRSGTVSDSAAAEGRRHLQCLRP